MNDGEMLGGRGVQFHGHQVVMLRQRSRSRCFSRIQKAESTSATQVRAAMNELDRSKVYNRQESSAVPSGINIARKMIGSLPASGRISTPQWIFVLRQAKAQIDGIEKQSLWDTHCIQAS